MNYLPDAGLFLLFALALLALGLGAFAPSRPLLEILVLPALATLGAFGLAIWICGSLGFYNGRFWALVFVALWLLWMIGRRQLVARNARRLLPAWRALSGLEKALALYLVAVWALVFVLSLAPPNGADYDSLVYHLAVPAQYARIGRIIELPYDSHSYFPFTLEMLYGVGLALRGPILAKLFHWLMLPLGAGVLVAWGARAQTRSGGLLAACLFTSLPMTLTEASTAYVDLGFAAFAAAAALCFCGAPTENRAHNLSWSGAFCGFCLGTKYFGWLIFGFLGVWLLIETARSRPRDGARQIAGFALCGLLLGGFWYGRNWLWTGNPVFPFAYGVFGGAGWTAQMARDYDASQAIYGFGKTPFDLLTLPWRLAMTPLSAAGFGGAVRGQPLWPLLPGPPAGNQTGLFDVTALALQTFPGPAIFAFGLPALLARGKPRAVGMAAWMFGFLWLFWALTSQQVRYLFPALALLSVVAGWGMAFWAPRLPIAKWLGGAFLVAWLGFAPALTLWQARETWSVLSGAQSPQEYQARFFSGTTAMQWINSNTPPDARVAVYGEPRDFYLDRSYFWADDLHNNLIDYPNIQTPAVLAGALKERGANYILLNADPRSGGVGGPPQPLFDQMVSAGRARLVFPLSPEEARAARGYRVYALAAG